MTMVDELPEARVRETPWQRVRTFVMIGPRRATEGPLQWAISLALVSSIVHLVFFLLIALIMTSDEPGLNLLAQLFIGILILVASLLFSGIQWVVTLATMTALGQIGRLLVRLPRTIAAIAGAVVVGAVSLAIEPIGGLMYHALAADIDLWRLGFWLIAAVLGGLWGAWLPRAFRPRAAP